MSDQSTSRGLPTSFSIGLPPEWFELDVASPDIADQIHRLVAERIPAGDEYTELRRLVEGQFRTFVALGRNVDLVMAAGFAEAVLDDRDAADIGDGDPPSAADQVALLVANLVVSMHGTDTVVSADDLGSLFTEGTGVDGSDRTVETVRLPVGPSVCLKETRPEWFEDAPDPSFFRFVQYLIPVEDGGGTAVLTFSTPSIPFIDDFEEVFLAVAETFEFVWAD